MYRRGHYLALGRDVAAASDFIEKKVLPNFTTNFKELVDEMYKATHKRPPKRIYRHKGLETSVMETLKKSSITVELDDPLADIEKDKQPETIDK